MIDRSTGGTSLPDGLEGSRLERAANTPDWFVDEVKRQFFRLEYGQSFSDAAHALWKVLQDRQ